MSTAVHRRPSRAQRLRTLAQAMTFPRGNLAEQWQAALERALAPHLARLEAEITALQDILELVVLALDYPCHVVGEVVRGENDASELTLFVPGDAVERPDVSPAEAVVFTYLYDLAHGGCYPDGLGLLAQGLEAMKDLLQPDPKFRAKLAALLQALPPEELEVLEARQGEWDEALAEREAWMRRTMAALDRLAPENA